MIRLSVEGFADLSSADLLMFSSYYQGCCTEMLGLAQPGIYQRSVYIIKSSFDYYPIAARWDREGTVRYLPSEIRWMSYDPCDSHYTCLGLYYEPDILLWVGADWKHSLLFPAVLEYLLSTQQ